MNMNSSSSIPSEKWNKSTYISKKLTERRKMENFAVDSSNRFAYNYRAEELDTLRNPSNGNQFDSLVRTTKKTTEMPNSCRLYDKKPWDFDGHYDGKPLLQSKELKKLFEEHTLKTVELSKTKNAKIIQPESYISPMATSVMLQEQFRELKRNGTFNTTNRWSSTGSLRLQTNTSSNTNQSTNNLPVVKFSNNKSRTYRVNKHSGVWEFNKIENRYMWSDTGSFEYDSRGDVDIKIDPDSYNYADPTLKTSVHTKIE